MVGGPAAELVAQSAAEPVQLTAADDAEHFASESVPAKLWDALTAGGQLAARVSRREALQVPAVMRARNMIAGTLSTLPVEFVRNETRTTDDPPSRLLDQIDPDVPNSVVLANTYEDLLFEGTAWWLVTGRGWHGYPTSAQYVPTDSVHVAGNGGLPTTLRISPDDPFPSEGTVFIDGVPYPDRDVIRFDSPNPPLLTHAARAIRIALRLDRTASDYADEPMPQGILTDKPESMDGGYEDDEVQELLDRWRRARQNNTWAYLGDLQAQVLQWSPEQLQLADARQHAVLEIARATGIDAEDLGVSTTSRTYANAESRRLALLDFTLAPFVRTVEQRLSMRDILPRGYHARINMDAFLRSDTYNRMLTYEVGLRVGAYTVDEIRKLEDKRALTPAELAEVTRDRNPAPQAAPADTGGNPA